MAEEASTESVAEETVEAAPEAPALEGQEATETTQEAPDFTEALSSIQAKLDKLTAPEEEPRGELNEELEQQYEYDYDDSDDDEFEYVDPTLERVQQLEQVILDRERADRASKLRSIAEQYPDIREHTDEISRVLKPLAERYNDPSLLTDPELVERIYKSIRAEADASAEIPAEEARGRGAKLETDASAGAPSEPDPEEEFLRAFGSGSDGNAFASR